MEQDNHNEAGQTPFSFANELSALSDQINQTTGALDSADMNNMDKPVEVELGRETYEKTRVAVEEFRAGYLEDLPLGEKTKAAMSTVIQEVLDGSGVQIFNNRRGRFVKYEMQDNGEWMIGSRGEAAIEVGPAMIDVHSEWVDTALAKSGLKLEPEQKEKLAYRWLVWHELGHGVQTAYARSAQPQPSPYVPDGLIANLADDTLREGVSAPYFEESKYEMWSNTAESERFAEGFSLMLLEKYALKELGLTPEQASGLRTALIPDKRRADMPIIESIIQESVTETGEFDYPRFYEQLANKNTSINGLGYGSPHTPEQVNKILLLTGQLENLPWWQRLGVNEPTA